MLLTHTARLYPTVAQRATLFGYLRASRLVFNRCLEQRKKAWEDEKRSISAYDQCKELTRWRVADKELAKIPADVLRDGVRRLDRAYQAFFRRVKAGQRPGFPRFKSARTWNSFEVQRVGEVTSYVSESFDRVRIQKLDFVRCRGLRPFTGQVKSLRVALRAGEWYAHLVVEDGVAKPSPIAVEDIQSAVGVDVGLTSFLTTDTGDKVENPRFLRAAEKKLRRAQRRVSRRVKGSANRRKAVQKVQRVHARVADVRRNFCHHVSKRLVADHDLIAVEDLRIANMARSRPLAKSIMDAAWGLLLWMLSYKAERLGKRVVFVDPRGTSQLCSACGTAVPKALSERLHRCPCGAALDRDENAARNLLARARLTLATASGVASQISASFDAGSTGGGPVTYACGDHVSRGAEPVRRSRRAGSAKQERVLSHTGESV